MSEREVKGEQKTVTLLTEMFPSAVPGKVNKTLSGHYLARSVHYSLYGEKKMLKSGIITRGAWMTYELFLRRADADGIVRASYEDLAGVISRTSLRRYLPQVVDSFGFLTVEERKTGRGKSVYRVNAIPETWKLDDDASHPFVRLRQREFATSNPFADPSQERGE